MSGAMALAVVQAELRMGRSVRAWVVRTLAFAAILGSYGVLAAMHASPFGALATFSGAYAPRLAVAALGGLWLYLLLIAAVLLAFDGRERDLRERIADVLGAKPLSNFVLLGGRLLAVVATVYVPLVVALALAQAFGLASEYFGSEAASAGLGWRLGAPLEPISLGVFLIIDVLPALALAAAATLFLAAVLRNRVLAASVALMLVGLHAWAAGSAPVHLLPAVSLVSAQGHAASDMLAQLPSHAVLLQRLCILLLAVALLHWAAAWHPRRDDASGARAQHVLPAVLTLAAAVGIAHVGYRAFDELQQREHWLQAHRAASAPKQADIVRIGGEVDIDPGVSLTLDLQVDLKFENVGAELVLSFNPGLGIDELRLAGNPVPFIHENGLLTIALPPTLGDAAATLDLSARGVPDAAFAYLDTAADYRRGTSANPLLLLGTAAALFDRDFVALMPAAHWLPSVGPNLDGAAADYFDLDIAISAPPGWRIAAPGPSSMEGHRFHARPAAPVPAFAVIAAPFERRTATIGDVAFELLLHRGHLRNVAFFADAVEGEHGIAADVGRILAQATANGMPYPYAALRVVEVPAQLRGYGGGWLMDTVMAQPGMLLVRESGFPTRRFEPRFRSPTFRTHLDHSPTGRKQAVLGSYAVWERSGGSTVQAARNLFGFQLSAAGPGAAAVDYLCRELGVRLLWYGRRIVQDREVYHNEFSAHSFHRPHGFSLGTGPVFANLLVGGDFLAIANRPTVWARISDTPLAELGGAPQADAQMLALKASALATAIFDAYGRERAAALLAELRQRHAARNFTAGDFEQAASDLGMPLRPLLGDWLNATALPGFLASEAQIYRLPDADGKPRYQVRVHVRNGEPVPGLVRLAYVLSSTDREYRVRRTVPVRIDGGTAVELGFVSEQAPRSVWLTPYLSLNRREFPLTLMAGRSGTDGDSAAFSGSRPSTWQPANNGDVVVDDLDAGFQTFDADPGADGLRLSARPPAASSADLDHGLPEHAGFSLQPWWTRQELPTSHGAYRRTTARNAGTDGVAVFTAALPRTARWQLDYHIPDLAQRSMGGSYSGRYDKHGAYRLTLVAGERRFPLQLDGAAAMVGWNTLGEFDVGGTVHLMVQSGAAEKTVAADAVRFRPARRQAQSARADATP